jgi:16S rRNA (adenine1518-N6/adenine1519-N6)-dimethyltransferase
MQSVPSGRIPTSRSGWVALLQQLDIRPSKGMGQNFLFEHGIVERLVRSLGVTREDTVVEIGPGLGILTDELVERAGTVISVELDRRLAAHLRRVFADVPSFELVEGDALAVDFDALVDRDYLVAANLPYSVGTAILRRLLETRRPPRRLALMMQREVAERLVAQPPGMTIVGVAAQFYARPRIAFTVPPSVFIPPPKVESAVIVMEARDDVPLPQELHSRFFRIVNAGFRHKRKQLANSIADELGCGKDAVSDWIRAAGLDPMRRAQTLSVDEWVALTKYAPLELLP